MPRRPHSSAQALALFSALFEQLPDWVHGYGLCDRTGLKSGTLYPLLMRLAEDGLLDARWEDSPQPGRPPRHLYRLTADGRALAEARLAEAEGRTVPRHSREART
ncbi:MAG TPA: PadR family transcriptional regulator [Alteraurantiacibacter sp.]